ncbi:mitochondrial carrier domain-containing protein [Cantharellus anzutake]|uniref:mitochondrial carrier domain-containing protein n=1 Tax=Cantharellus anzutake TaxID=1750568 RepID=UPI00190854D7|nr:mitochondrial carrier domain-containing protein [Cantharellus anzutake]XP_038918319.1 mitochondrial carrier domain-containing protein [Cantharellus anzutake]KAF8316024.1 mitochondrial carrier domain-containing protein [Cantharellus anzutake]KAF8334891.1 mitochondrial carrier domain-containing protein [Cantharellus anzutake]
MTSERAKALKHAYLVELTGKCTHPSHYRGQNASSRLDWVAFKRYADAKERELWAIFHDELDLDGNGHLDAAEWAAALQKTGIYMSPQALSDFMTAVTSSPDSPAISFTEFRDYLLLLPREISPREIHQYYEMRRLMGDDGRGPARVTMEGDVSLSGEDSSYHTQSHHVTAESWQQSLPTADHSYDDHHDADDTDEEEEEDDSHHLLGSSSLKFLLAGGVAGVVSRTATAPFDRLKVYLMTTSIDLVSSNISLNAAPATSSALQRGTQVIWRAILNIYAEGGVRAFWVGNALNTAKIMPESAIKFMSYETAKQAFAKYVDKVDDPREISGVSRFISGGIGGMTSQLAIYPIETLKTQMMSTAGSQTRSLMPSIKRVWALGGFPAYYRGLVIGLVGVFPYSAIDMSTFEALKLAYVRSTGISEPGVLALLAFGSISGSVGATSVYPINLIRTRLQASGSSGHPQRYDGMMDVIRKTYSKEGWKSFYKGLVPTLAKVVPAVSISYVVYESTKRQLGVA